MRSLLARLSRASTTVLNLMAAPRPKAKTPAEWLAEEDRRLGWHESATYQRPSRFQMEIDRSTQFDRFTNGGHGGPRF